MKILLNKIRIKTIRLQMKIFKTYAWIARDGIYFYYKGDEVTWLWWWSRNSSNNIYFSIGFCSYFKTLEEVDVLWEGYFKESEKSNLKLKIDP